MKRILMVLLCCFTLTCVNAQQKNKKKNAGAKEEKQWEMKQYFMVFLKSGPNRDQDSATAAQIQAGHLKHLDDMYKEGKLDIAGPFGDKGEIRGICVYNVATLEETKKLVEMDPAIKAGRLVAEIHPWWAAKTSTLR
jgi:uncharacterized protein